MFKNYWWFLFTIPALALIIFYVNTLLAGRKSIKQKKQVPKNFFIWVIAIIIGFLLFFQWLFDHRFNSLIYLIFSVVWIIGGVFRLIYEWRKGKDPDVFHPNR